MKKVTLFLVFMGIGLLPALPLAQVHPTVPAPDYNRYHVDPWGRGYNQAPQSYEDPNIRFERDRHYQEQTYQNQRMLELERQRLELQRQQLEYERKRELRQRYAPVEPYK